ncbi:hypothetical protein D3C73_999370 [compost metagenome]
MNHAGAEDFQPAALLAETAAMAAAFEAAHIHLNTRLGEREEAWTQADACVGSEHFLHELLQRALQIAHADMTADYKTFDLMELEGVGRIVVIAAEHLARTDDFDRSLPLHRLHGADLHRRGLCTHQDVFCQIEGILHIAGRMVLRQVERFKVIIIRFYLRTFSHPVAHSDENILDFPDDTAHRVNPALRQTAARQGYVYLLSVQAV